MQVKCILFSKDVLVFVIYRVTCMLDMCVLFYNFLFLLYTVLYFIHVVLKIENLKLVLILFQYRSVKGGVLLPLVLLLQLISVACNSLKQDLYHILVSTCVRSDALPWFHYRRGYLEASRQQGEQLEESTQTSLSNSHPQSGIQYILYDVFHFTIQTICDIQSLHSFM